MKPLPKIGIDLLGAAEYPDRAIEIIRAIRKRYPNLYIFVRVIYRASGWKDGNKVLNLIVKEPNVSAVGVNGLWHDSHIFTQNNLPEVLQICERVNKISLKYPETHFYCAPTLENKMDRTLAEKYAQECSKVLNKVHFIHSFIDGGTRLPGYINEIHHKLQTIIGQYIHGWDGLDQYDSDVLKFIKTHVRAIFNVAWCFPFNLKYTNAVHSDGRPKDNTPRHLRKLIPPVKLGVSLIAQLVEPKGSTRLPASRIYKAYSEPEPFGGHGKGDHGTPDPRSWQMAYLTPFDGEVTFRVKGKIIAKFNKTTTIHDGKRIYRFPKYCLDVFDEVKAIKGNGLVNVWEGNAKIGIVNVLFREGSFKNT